MIALRNETWSSLMLMRFDTMSEKYQRNPISPARLSCWVSLPFVNLTCHREDGKNDKAEKRPLSVVIYQDQPNVVMVIEGERGRCVGCR